MVAFRVAHLPIPGGASAPKTRGSLPPLPPPPVWRHDAACGAGPAPHRALPQRTGGIRANPCPIRLSRQGPDHSSEGAPSEREALWLSKACATPRL